MYSIIPCYLLLTYGAQVDVSFFEVMIVMAMVNVLAVLPISINGIGVVDGAFVYLMGNYHVPYEAALAVMMIIRALVITLSLIGAVFSISWTAERPPRLEAELSRIPCI